ncbi:MAG: autotransporter assembly complex family protein [Pseudomonadota bacterium]
MKVFIRLVIALAALVCSAAPAAADKAALEIVGDQSVRAAIEAALPEEAVPQTAFEARRQARRAASVAANVLNAEGRFDAKIETGVELGETPRPRLRIDPGPVFQIAGVRLRFSAPEPNEAAVAAAESAASLQPGAPAIPEDFYAAEARVVGALRDAGYPDAEIAARDVAGDRGAATVDVTFDVASGARARFGDLIIPDNVKIRRRYVERLSPIEPGDLYSPEAIAKLSARLAETRMFRTSAARLASPPADTPEGVDETRDVDLVLVERKRNSIAVGGSFATDEGPGAEIEYQRRNFTRRADTLTVLATVAELQRALSAEWRLPNQPRLRRSLIFDAGFSNETTDAFDRNAVEAGGALEVRFRGGAVGLGARYEFSKETAISGDGDESEEERTLHIASIAATGRIDRTDDPLDSMDGWRARTLIEPSAAFGDDSSRFVRAVAQGAAFLPLADERRWVAAGRLRLGTVLGASVLDVPADRRFFAGGGGSIRGFGFQEVGPRNADGVPIGGRGLLETSAEIRWRATQSLGFVGFVDAGSVSGSNSPSLRSLRYGAGLGVRYATPAGPIRVDVAVPIDRTEFDDAVQVYISIGQAF